MKLYSFLHYCALGMFLLAGVMAFSYVYDIEYIGGEKRYEMDKADWKRDHPLDGQVYMSYNEWEERNERREERMWDYIGEECAACWDSRYDRDYNEPNRDHEENRE